MNILSMENPKAVQGSIRPPHNLEAMACPISSVEFDPPIS
jgi:hypothetical protein